MKRVPHQENSCRRQCTRTLCLQLLCKRAAAHQPAAPHHLTLQAVSKPKLVATSLFLRSPSMVLGTPITLVGTPAHQQA